MSVRAVRLKFLLQQQHWQTYRTFRTEFNKAAESIDSELAKSAPSRAQLHRWLSGDLKGLPYPHHCRVLEKMFPGWTAQQLFEVVSPDADQVSRLDNSRETQQAQVEELFEAIDTGISAPDFALADWGPLASPTPSEQDAIVEWVPSPIGGHVASEVSAATRELGKKLLALAKVLRLSPEETKQLAGLSGNIIELGLKVDIDVEEDGWARLTYRHELVNLTARPFSRISRELWFEHTDGPLIIKPVSEGKHRVVIQRVHDTATLAKFACQISPPVQPGEVAVVGYTSQGGQFCEDHYWRQSIARYTRHLTIRLRHRGAGQLMVCSAIEEHPDGSENSATEELMWDYEDDDVVITLTRNYLRPSQAVTLRWNVTHERS